VFSGVADHLLKLGLQPKVRDSSFDFNLVYIAYMHLLIHILRVVRYSYELNPFHTYNFADGRILWQSLYGCGVRGHLE